MQFSMSVGHGYISTACFHEQHNVCRLECKFCSSFCLCKCHYEKDSIEVQKRFKEEINKQD